MTERVVPAKPESETSDSDKLHYVQKLMSRARRLVCARAERSLLALHCAASLGSAIHEYFMIISFARRSYDSLA
jgi:hypothetical protein